VPLQGRFMLAFNKADIVDVLEQASRWTCRNFIYTDDIARGKITLLSKTAVTTDEAYAAFLAALNANNIVIYPTGKYYKLGRAPDSKKLPIPTYTDPDTGVPFSEQVVTKVIKLQSTDADMLRGVLGNFISPQGADIQSIPPDTLIITDTGINIRRIEKILDSVDKSGGADVIRVIQIRYAAAKDVADKLNQIFQAQGAGRKGIAAANRAVPGARVPQPVQPGQPGQPGVQGGGAEIITVSKVLADDRTNKLIVIADDKSFLRVQELLDQLDVPTGADGGIHVVFLKNASAEDLATTLSNLAQGQSKRQGAAPVPTSVPGAPPGARPAAPAAPEATTAELFSGEVKVTADKQQNALLIQASGADFAAINRLIEKLDRPRRQVFVEAVIMEVNLDNSSQFGVAAHGFVDVEVNGKKAVLPLVSQPAGPNGLSSFNLATAVGLGGFLTGLNGPTSGTLKDLTGGQVSLPSIGIVLRALQSSSDVNVISTPHVLATDNEESEISVGQNVPFQTGFISSNVSNLLNSGSSSNVSSLLGTSGLSGLASGIQRQNVELRLKMKPQINEGGNVRLTVEVANEEIASNDATLGPTTSKRSVKTLIVAHDQSTIVIGGLIQERLIHSVKKVPILGSLPVLGSLFRDTTNSKQRTNLLVFLTPYIIRDEGDYRRIYEKKRKEQDDFTAQFYGKKSPYTVDIDYSRKPGPLARLHQGVVEETARAENGGPGLPGEGVTTPPGAPVTRPGRTEPAPPAAPAPESPPAQPPAAPPDAGEPPQD
jgi:general secretion pathway protein D